MPQKPRYIRPSIRVRTLPIHLNETADKHRGLNYRMFRILRDAGVDISNMGRAFNVSRHAMRHWWNIDDEEQQIQ